MNRYPNQYDQVPTITPGGKLIEVPIDDEGLLGFQNAHPVLGLECLTFQGFGPGVRAAVGSIA